MTFFPSSHDRELELLSAYLDNQLGPAERARLERRLAQEPQLQATLDDLRSVKTTLVALPKVKPPRNFTLTLKQLEARGLAAPARPPIRLFAVVNLATALAAVLFAVLVTADLGGRFNVAAPASAPAEAQQVELVEAPVVATESFSIAEAPAAEDQATTTAGAVKSTTPTPEINAFLAPSGEPAEPLTGLPGEGGGGGGGGGAPGPAGGGTSNDAGGGGGDQEVAPAGVTATAVETATPPEAVAQAIPTESPTLDSASRTRATGEAQVEVQTAGKESPETLSMVRLAEIALGLTVILLIVVSLFLRRR